MKKKFLNNLVIISLLALSFQIFISSAQTNSETASDTQSYLVATVNVYNATNTQINKSTYSISFQLKNRVGIQSGIRYGLELINTDTRVTADTYLANTSLTLGPNEGKNITMTYAVPSYISPGDYKLYIVSENSHRVVLTRFPIKDLTIKTTGVNPIPSLDQCNPKTELSTGGATLQATCQVNNFEKNDQLSVYVHKGDRFGEIVSQQTLNVAPDQNQNLTFETSVSNEANLYTLEVFLLNNKNQKISASTYLRYNTNSSQFNIQNIVLDKNSYQVGETAKVKIFWSDLSKTATSSYAFQVALSDKNQQTCGEATKNINEAEGALQETDLDISITNACTGVIAQVGISKDGNHIAQENIDSNLDAQNININPSFDSNGGEILSINKFYVVFFIIILVIVGYGIILFRKGHRKNNSIKK